ncbi:hypothetical protein CUMW_118180 [Citrus unshiu]|nr:hypothetical protein CUMW_118180 [Citrus unshiu]
MDPPPSPRNLLNRARVLHILILSFRIYLNCLIWKIGIDVSIRDPFIWRLYFIELEGRDYVKPFQEHWC